MKLYKIRLTCKNSGGPPCALNLNHVVLNTSKNSFLNTYCYMRIL